MGHTQRGRAGAKTCLRAESQSLRCVSLSQPLRMSSIITQSAVPAASSPTTSSSSEDFKVYDSVSYEEAQRSIAIVRAERLGAQSYRTEAGARCRYCTQPLAYRYMFRSPINGELVVVADACVGHNDEVWALIWSHWVPPPSDEQAAKILQDGRAKGFETVCLMCNAVGPAGFLEAWGASGLKCAPMFCLKHLFTLADDFRGWQPSKPPKDTTILEPTTSPHLTTDTHPLVVAVQKAMQARADSEVQHSKK